MRDIVFLVADGQMEETVKGFFENPAYERRLECKRFEFDARQDLLNHPGKDPGVYSGAHKFLKLYLHTHQHAVVMLDFDFNDNLQNKDYDELCKEINENMVSVGWPEDRFFVMAINPELEVLMWQQNTQGIELIIDYPGQQGSLRKWLGDCNLWPNDAPKPPDPKAAIDKVRSQSWGQMKTRSQIFKHIAKNVSFRDCQDQAFVGLWRQFQAWYPVVWI